MTMVIPVSPLISRVHGEGPCYRDPLFLSARKAPWTRVLSIREADELEKAHDLLVDLLALVAPALHGKGDVVVDGLPFKQRELLEDHPNLSAELSDFLVGHVLDLVAVHYHAARLVIRQPIDTPEQRGLSRTTTPNQGIHLPVGDVEADVLEDLASIRPAFTKVLYLYHV